MSQDFDYVIVGAGSAGCVLANRLSENPDYRVCLIEAGPEDRNPFIHMPFGVLSIIRSTVLNWGFWTEPQPQLSNRRLYWPRGRMLGGSSSLNAQVYIRGHQGDYDDWEGGRGQRARRLGIPRHRRAAARVRFALAQRALRRAGRGRGGVRLPA
jgi:choline dehydrogenase